MLVHDDLIDGSVIRRGRPTLHEAIRIDDEGQGNPKRAGDLGLIAGDLLFSLGMRLIARSGLDDAPLGRANRLLADMLFETGLGEALDVLYDGCPLEHLAEEHLGRVLSSQNGPIQRGRASCSGSDSGRGDGTRDPGSRPVRGSSRLRLSRSRTTSMRFMKIPTSATSPTSMPASELLSSGLLTKDWMNAVGRSLEDALDLEVGPERRRRLRTLIRSTGAIEACLARVESVRREAVEVLRESPLDPTQRRQFIALTEMFRTPRPTLPAFAPVPMGGIRAETGLVDA